MPQISRLNQVNNYMHPQLKKFLISHQATFDGNILIHFGDLKQELAKVLQQNCITPVTEFSLIQISGPDAEKFLQGQITCDVLKMDETHASLAACCDHKGRMIANFWISRDAKKNFFLSLPSSNREPLLDHLKKYAVFSKIELKPLDDSWAMISISGPAVSNTLLPEQSEQNDFLISRTFAPNINGFSSRVLIIGNIENIISVWDKLKGNNYLVGTSAWKLLNISNGLAFVYPETSGLFIPQMINLQLLDGVSFTKGCFVGQEIIARTQHLGILKRHLYRGISHYSSSPKIGSQIYNAQNQSVGVIVESAPHLENDYQNKYQSLAVIEDRAIINNETDLKIDDGKNQISFSNIEAIK